MEIQLQLKVHLAQRLLHLQTTQKNQQCGMLMLYRSSFSTLLWHKQRLPTLKTHSHPVIVLDLKRSFVNWNNYSGLQYRSLRGSKTQNFKFLMGNVMLLSLKLNAHQYLQTQSWKKKKSEQQFPRHSNISISFISWLTTSKYR